MLDTCKLLGGHAAPPPANRACLSPRVVVVVSRPAGSAAGTVMVPATRIGGPVSIRAPCRGWVGGRSKLAWRVQDWGEVAAGRRLANMDGS